MTQSPSISSHSIPRSPSSTVIQKSTHVASILKDLVVSDHILTKRTLDIPVLYDTAKYTPLSQSSTNCEVPESRKHGLTLKARKAAPPPKSNGTSNQAFFPKKIDRGTWQKGLILHCGSEGEPMVLFLIAAVHLSAIRVMLGIYECLHAEDEYDSYSHLLTKESLRVGKRQENMGSESDIVIKVIRKKHHSHNKGSIPLL
ncbi:hypothetical protein AUEXF2481DRAFT_193392 [Aureobasidium subglaciale EXF-2481]|uniref:Uncharacterized protein n=1 Tax=Aureobasidium subglaciale (strain EXF-2481) TaxID=1043005 RepID=A0A074YPU2_AURSE|nr:uncharacterized protein AUEXF2481DRAFT_193392 [Aureobasidium subglaciale EXF-2481]KEQ99720.1 hypothetical protein AUEXF2481DRAFT_193392 [Aureobasidium subglaciale EXF-2481]